MESKFYHFESANALDARPSVPSTEMFRDLTYGHHLQQVPHQEWPATEAVGSAAPSPDPMVPDPQSSWRPVFDVEVPELPIRFCEEYDDHLKLFRCCMCSIFSSNCLNELQEHVSRNRSLHQPPGVLTDVMGVHICKLCCFRTDSKEDLHLHCSTREHLMRVDLVNHVKEGGDRNEWKLNHAACTVLVQCTACGYFADSLMKLRHHVTDHFHTTNTEIFALLQEKESQTRGGPWSYFCALCNVSAKTKVQLIQHTLTMAHMKTENFYKLRSKCKIDLQFAYVVKSCEQAPAVSDKMMNQRGIKRGMNESETRSDDPTPPGGRSNPEVSANILERERRSMAHFEVGGDHRLPSREQLNFDSQRLARIIECLICGLGNFRNFIELESHIVHCHSFERLVAQKYALANLSSGWETARPFSSSAAPFATVPNVLFPPPPYPGLQVPFMQSSRATYPLSDQTHINQHPWNMEFGMGPPVPMMSPSMLEPPKPLMMDRNSPCTAGVYVPPPLTAVVPSAMHPYMVPASSPPVGSPDVYPQRNESPRQPKKPKIEIDEEQARIIQSHLVAIKSPEKASIHELMESTGLPASAIVAWLDNAIQRSKNLTKAVRDPPLNPKNADEVKLTARVENSRSLPNENSTKRAVVSNENQKNSKLSEIQCEKFSTPPAESKALSSAATPSG